MRIDRKTTPFSVETRLVFTAAEAKTLKAASEIAWKAHDLLVATYGLDFTDGFDPDTDLVSIGAGAEAFADGIDIDEDFG